MRKLLLSLVALFFMTGVVVAAEVVFLKYIPEKNELRVKDGDKEITYKLTDKTKVTVVAQDGTTKVAELKVLEKAKEGKTKFELTVDKETVTEIRTKIGKKKN